MIDGDIRQAGGTDSASGQRQDEKDEKDENGRRRGKRGRKGVGDWWIGREGMAGLPGGETTPNVNTNYSPCASVASATALQLTA